MENHIELRSQKVRNIVGKMPPALIRSECKKSKPAYWVSVYVDVLQGIPSIVIGIIGYLWLVVLYVHSKDWKKGIMSIAY